MSGLPILDVAIGLAFSYLLLALICTTLMEWIAQVRNLRGRTLYDGTRAMLGEDGKDAKESPMTNAVFSHPLIRDLGDVKRLPSYLPSKLFARTLRDVLAATPQANNLDAERAQSLVNGDLLRSLRAMRSSSDQRDVAANAMAPGAATDDLPSEATLAEWFDHGMDRVSGTYKRTTQRVVIVLSILVTLALNANSITLTSMLWQSPTLRAYMVERAKVRLDQGPPLETVEYVDPTTPEVTAPVSADSGKSPDRLLSDEQTMLGQIFSWSGEPDRVRHYQSRFGPMAGFALWLLLSIIGWLVTALAVSLGAPFWFDTLNRFMRARSAGDIPRSTTPKENAA